MYEYILPIVLATPPAILGTKDIIRWVIVVLNDRGKLKSLQEQHTTSDAYKQFFYVKSTYAKYIMGEGLVRGD